MIANSSNKTYSRYSIFLLGVILAFSLSLSGQSALPDHSLWTALLQEHVDEQGMVNYTKINENAAPLDEYLKQLASHPPEDGWTQDEKLVYWMNAYNAFTIRLILDHFPLKSIMDIDEAWDKEFIQLGGKTLSLNDIEHKIIRKEFDEPRIHFALVCAAISCPILLNQAYEASTMNDQLDQQASLFINDVGKNQFTEKKARVSQIFNWFEGDFTKKESLVDYLNRYSETKLDAKAKISFMDYNWQLNGQ